MIRFLAVPPTWTEPAWTEPAGPVHPALRTRLRRALGRARRGAQ